MRLYTVIRSIKIPSVVWYFISSRLVLSNIAIIICTSFQHACMFCEYHLLIFVYLDQYQSI